MCQEAKTDERQKVEPGSNLFIIEGMQLSIPPGGLTMRIGPSGNLEIDPVILHVGLDPCPYWINIAFEHLRATDRASSDARKANQAGDAKALAAALEDEFKSGMQAIVAGNIAMDAFYAAVKEHIELPKDLTRTWREKKTARYKQVAEVLRRAFPMSKESSALIRQILQQNYGLRDRAVHPSAGTGDPLLHPELGIGTEWRFVFFRFYNAKAVVGLNLSVIVQLTARPHQNKFENLRRYCETLNPRLLHIVNAWESVYGELYEKKQQREGQGMGSDADGISPGDLGGSA